MPLMMSCWSARARTLSLYTPALPPFSPSSQQIVPRHSRTARASLLDTRPRLPLVLAMPAAPALPTSLDYPRIKLLVIGDVGVGKSCLIKRYCEGRFVAKYIPTIGIDFGVKKVEVSKAAVLQQRSSEPSPPAATAQSGGGASSAIPPAVRVNFWDGSGDGDYREILNEFYEAAQGVLLMYDARNAQSFAALQSWWEELTVYCQGMPAASGGGGGGSGSGGGGGSNPALAGNAAAAGAGGKRASASNIVTSGTAAGKAVGRTDGRAPIVVLCANKVDDTAVPGAAAPRPRAVSEEQGRAWAREHGCAAYYETSASTGQNVKEVIEDLVVWMVAKFM
ncbi:ras family protein-like protein [Leishmania major strain Friedlin]|uniref:Ras family protein-like protein n=1 Tax=Leishmania major TaxID=5664 RepID=Q4QHT9_LEIMA|nr:ras family protein-like protein [Leishmania major strain Friedlin]CAJ02739.1 ras family protein-like protein [Leishmania major strain Friedlin]|eukprot:XP_001681259.1 ras family protein-like protein [Leishmania major strain Friedlin]